MIFPDKNSVAFAVNIDMAMKKAKTKEMKVQLDGTPETAGTDENNQVLNLIRNLGEELKTFKKNISDSVYVIKTDIETLKQIRNNLPDQLINDQETISEESYAGISLRAVEQVDLSGSKQTEFLMTPAIRQNVRSIVRDTKKEINLGTAKSLRVRPIKKYPNTAAAFISRLEPETDVENIKIELKDLNLNF